MNDKPDKPSCEICGGIGTIRTELEGGREVSAPCPKCGKEKNIGGK